MYDGGARKFHCDDDDALMANDTKFTFSILFARACVYPSLFRTKKKQKKNHFVSFLNICVFRQIFNARQMGRTFNYFNKSAWEKNGR